MIGTLLINAGAGTLVIDVAEPPDEMVPVHADGQTFVTRPDLATGSAGSTYRYALYRHTSPITSANIGGLTPAQTSIPNNSGQVFGGTPDTASGQAFTAANRYDATAQMAKLPDGTQLAYGTCLAVHTCTQTGNFYYALLETTTSEAVNPGVNATTVPLAETAIATTYPKPILWGDGSTAGTRGSASLRITGTTGLPAKIVLHASSGAGGAPGQNVNGDYWQWHGDGQSCYQDGVQTAWAVYELQSATPNLLTIHPRDTIWQPDGQGANAPEGWWQGGYMDPADGAAAFRPYQHRRLQALLAWLSSHYTADMDRVVLQGQSMGAWGSLLFGLRNPTQVAAVFLNMPSFRTYTQGSGGWPRIEAGQPFTADPGTDASLVAMEGGGAWGGAGGWADGVGLVTSAGASANLPFVVASLGRQDGYATWSDFVAGINALEADKHGYACYWDNSAHTGTNGSAQLYSGAAGAKAWALYGDQTFDRGVSYPAFTASSINENIGDGTVGNGDLTGGRNVGFSWTTPVESAAAWSCSISNGWMGQTPTGSPASGDAQTGPVGGPYSTMTVSVTPRRRQSFNPAVSATVNYAYTPFGGVETTGSVLVDANGQITIPGVVINSTGATALSLST